MRHKQDTPSNEEGAGLPKSSSRLPFSSRTTVVLVVVVIVAVVGIALYVSRSKPTSTVSAETTAPAEVDITSSGFVPATISVKPGQDVEWLNKDSKSHYVASDPYPTNNTLADLNSHQNITSGESYNYIFETPGTFTYHDNLHPTLGGTVIVGGSTQPTDGQAAK